MKKSFIALFLLANFNVLAQNKAETLGSDVNTEYNELHPVLSVDGKTLYFARADHPMNNKGTEFSIDIWFSQKTTDGRWGIAKRMPRQMNRDRFNDIFDISADGNTALVRNEYQKGIINPDKVGLSIIKKKGNIWQAPEALDIPSLSKLAKGKYLSACMSTNGKVIILGFSEKKEGSEDDLYVTILDKNNEWSEPKPIGKDINTTASERSPFLSPDNSTLYFASDRKNGQGGYDVWMSKRRGNGWFSWTTPINLGPSINSDKDEMSFVIETSGEYAYFSSKNNSLGHHDLFKIKVSDILQPNTIDEAALQSTELAKVGEEGLNNTLQDANNPTNVAIVTGKVEDITTGKPVEAKIIYEDLDTGEELGVSTSDAATGIYKILLPYGKRYGIRPELDNNIGVSRLIDLTIPGDFKEITGQNLETAPLKAGSTVTLYNVFFEFAKATLEKESFLELDRMIGVMTKNPNMAIEVQGHTDNVGSDAVNMRLSQQRADAVKNYFLEKGVSADRVKSTGMGESKPVATNETTEGQAKNRRVEFIVLRK